MNWLILGLSRHIMVAGPPRLTGKRVTLARPIEKELHLGRPIGNRARLSRPIEHVARLLPIRTVRIRSRKQKPQERNTEDRKSFSFHVSSLCLVGRSSHWPHSRGNSLCLASAA